MAAFALLVFFLGILPLELGANFGRRIEQGDVEIFELFFQHRFPFGEDGISAWHLGDGS